MSRLKGLGVGKGREGNLIVVLTFLLMAAFFYVLPTVEGKTVEWSSVYSAGQTFATYGLLALAVGLGMLAGQLDLSTLGMFALGGLIGVKAGTEGALVGVVAAGAVGILAGVIQGLLVSRLKLNSMSVTLGGYLVLLGLNQAIDGNEPAVFANVNLGIELDKPILEVLSIHSIVVLAAFVLVGLVLHYTRIGRDCRAVGADERASRVAGVRTGLVLVGVLAVSGMLSGVAGALNGFSLSAAAPNPGFAPLVFAVTAALIGGVAFGGGRGSAFGIALGALALSLLQATFGILASPEWVSSTVTGCVLAAAAIAVAPRIGEHLANARGRRRKPSDAGDRRPQPPRPNDSGAISEVRS